MRTDVLIVNKYILWCKNSKYLHTQKVNTTVVYCLEYPSGYIFYGLYDIHMTFNKRLNLVNTAYFTHTLYKLVILFFLLLTILIYSAIL